MANLSSLFSGLGTGASLGSMVPGIGTALGAGAGGLLGYLLGSGGGGGQGSGGFFGGTPSQTTQLPRFTEQQQQALNTLLSQGMQTGLGPLEEQARTSFEQKTVPTLAERFNKLGMGQTALTSPSFASQLGAAGAGLEKDIAGMKSQRGLQMAQLGLTPQFENIFQPERPSGLGQFAGGIAPGLGQLLGLLAAGGR